MTTSAELQALVRSYYPPLPFPQWRSVRRKRIALAFWRRRRRVVYVRSFRLDPALFEREPGAAMSYWRWLRCVEWARRRHAAP